MDQELNADTDVQQLKRRRQNLMYQVAVLQLQKVRANSLTRLHHFKAHFHCRNKMNRTEWHHASNTIILMYEGPWF
jgi:hypothetical protein